MKFLKRSKTRILLFLAVVGPGFITANVDNDAGGILTYSQAGAQFGHLLLWTMIPITLALIVVQEMSARMGVVTGKGLSDLIREEFGFRITFFMMIGILITNFGNVVTEFIGIATSLELFGLSRYATVPVCCVIVWLIVVKGQYKTVEKVFLAASFFYVTYIFAGVLAHPVVEGCDHRHLQTARSASLSRSGVSVHGDRRGGDDDCALDAVLPAVVDRGEGRDQARQYKASALDVVTGCIFTDVVAWFIIVACAATLYVHGFRNIKYAADAAQALKPLAGRLCLHSFCRWTVQCFVVCGVDFAAFHRLHRVRRLGFRIGSRNEIWRSAGFLLALYALIIAGGAVVLIPGLPLVKIAVLSQVVNGVVLPFVLIFMLLLINKKELMGEYVNTRLFNVVAWRPRAS